MKIYLISDEATLYLTIFKYFRIKFTTMKLFSFALLTFFGFNIFSQSTSHTMLHNGLTREYLRYVPASYDGSSPVPILFNLHGYTSNNGQQEFYGDFRAIADTANFILVHPNGTIDGLGNRFWNAFGASGGVDDVGFISALIDKIDEDYNIDLNRVYSCGMSNGGFMSYKLGCELSSRITAVASVTGTMATNATSNCNPTRPMPIMQIHGTADPTVPYAGNASMMGIENVVTYWRDFNNCDVPPEFTAVPDINATDLCTAERYVYVNGNSGSTVEFFKIINGAHTWPGAPITIGVTNQDINASAEIWRFFSQYSIDNLVSLEDYNLEDSFSIYPNPSIEKFTVATTEIVDFIQVSDLQGRMIQKIRPSGQQTEIELQSAGAYFITIFHGQNQVTKRIVMD